MINYVYDESEGTLLLPIETHWRCEAWLVNTDHLLHWNKYDTYEFSFSPHTMQDDQMLYETIDMAKAMVEMRRSPYSSKTRIADKASYLRGGLPYCSQLFLPKLNVEVEHPDQLRGKLVSISGHMRDTKDGRLYLQADYIDAYEQWDEEPVAAHVDSDSDW